jgi:hypothetical protein
MEGKNRKMRLCPAPEDRAMPAEVSNSPGLAKLPDDFRQLLDSAFPAGEGGFPGGHRASSSQNTGTRRWDGTPKGYEGFLCDDYYAMLAVPVRQMETAWESGFRPATALS